MGDVALTLEDGTVVWLRADGPAGGRPDTGRIPPPAVDSEHGRGGEHGKGGGHGEDGGDGELELPDAFGAAQPVSVDTRVDSRVDSRMGRALTRGGEVLEEALRPLGGVLGQIHRSLSSGSHRPDEVTVEFGVTLGSDLSLGVFSGSGEASFTVSATWHLGNGRGEPGGAGSTGEPGGAGSTGELGGDAGAGEPGGGIGPGEPGGGIGPGEPGGAAP
ncbi:CU044_2847 family protein [Streptomyces sp. NPDC001339]|uniref:CU044_2847 family protein n=1 Tax=Streptomyces sp. NPDC001339 TaxID=3364563 RepID=UPI00368C7A7A